MIDKNSIIPIYSQLQQIIKNGIMSGVYKDGELIPSETQLASQYNITRTTVRRAINDLVNEGLLNKVHGKGTYVNLAPAKYSIWNFGGFTNYLKKNGRITVSKVIKSNKVTIDDKTYLELVRARGTNENGRIVYLTIDTSLIPLKLFPGIDQYDFSERSLYETMREVYHLIPKTAEIGVEPTMSNPLADTYFHCGKNIPLLVVKGNIFSDKHIELEKVNVLYSPNIHFKMAVNME